MFLTLVSTPSSTVRVGVIGFGQWGPNHVRNFSQFDGCDVLRVCDASDARLTAAQKFLRGVAVTKNSAEITDATVDATDASDPNPNNTPKSDPSIWLMPLRQTIRQALLAELDTRLQPALGLLEALTSIATPEQ